MVSADTFRVSNWTIVGLALLLMPLTTVWHEIGGHAATCVAQGGQVTELGAFYVQCAGLSGLPRALVSVAGVTADCVLAGGAFLLWRRATGDLARLILWYVWVMKGQVAAGYFLFSGFTNFGDLGLGANGGLSGLTLPPVVRLLEIVLGGLSYSAVVFAAIRGLNKMLGDSEQTHQTRRHIGHLFYCVVGVAAVLVGLFNPLGIIITLMSAAASSFGGNAGFISIGYSSPRGPTKQPFSVATSWVLVACGLAATLVFGVVLGPTVRLR